MDLQEISRLAKRLDQATLEAQEIERLTLTLPQLSLDEAYSIQALGIKVRESRGEKPIGFKMGLTSKAKREQMNLNSPVYGVLTDKMEVPDQGVFPLRGTIHPKIEPEIAFVVAREIRHPLKAEEALEACSGICAAMEILDSRYLGFKYFSLPDVVADNCSSAFFVLSKTMKSPRDFSFADLANLKMSMEVNGQIVQKESSGAISGNPILSLVQLTEMLSSHGVPLPAGSIVLAGAATPAVALESGAKIQLHVENLGSVSLTIGPTSH